VDKGLVHHSDCWEKAVNDMSQKFCDDYCRWPREVKDEDGLEELHFASCPLIQVLNLGL